MMSSSPSSYVLRTPRLGLRSWKEEDIESFSAITADPLVMRYFPKLLDRAETESMIERLQQHYQKHGYCFYAVERLDEGQFIGFIGLNWVDLDLDFTPCTEIGWRLHPSAWGQGFATEGARACLKQAFTTLGLQTVYAFTPHENRPSERVMQRLGMQARGRFHHPMMDKEHPLQPVLKYEISMSTWQQTQSPNKKQL